jgi:glycosyltransferase involved in cell wall biosynthesis
MKITYFYRNPQCGFSIQRVFQTLTKEFAKSAEVEEVFLPSHKAGILSIFCNGLFAFNKRSKQINHITGDAHYLTYFLPSKKTIVTVHDLMYYSSLSGWKKRIWKFLYINSLQNVSKIVFISEFAKKQVTDVINLPADKISIIPDAVSADYEYNKKEFNEVHPVILHIGTLERKNLRNTILALKNIPCHLRIIGKINAETQYLLHENNIEYSNAFNLTNEQIIKEYENCDIVNFPSTFEGFGMPIIEGQTVGRIVITSNISPMKEVAGDAAILVNPFDIDSIRDAYIDVIANQSLREEIISKGCENIKRFQVEKIVQQYTLLYHNILST